jgi:hypothetical protein
MSIWTILLALAAPIGWGLLSAWAFDRWAAHRKARAADADDGCRAP